MTENPFPPRHYRYIFSETDPARVIPDGVSGFKTTQVGNLWFMSVPGYGPDDHDWWRSQCGHTVDKALAECPVCGEQQPQ